MMTVRSLRAPPDPPPSPLRGGPSPPGMISCMARVPLVTALLRATDRLEASRPRPGSSGRVSGRQSPGSQRRLSGTDLRSCPARLALDPELVEVLVVPAAIHALPEAV